MRMADGGSLGVMSRSMRSSVGVSRQAVVTLPAAAGGAFAGGGDVVGGGAVAVLGEAVVDDEHADAPTVPMSTAASTAPALVCRLISYPCPRPSRVVAVPACPPQCPT